MDQLIKDAVKEELRNHSQMFKEHFAALFAMSKRKVDD